MTTKVCNKCKEIRIIADFKSSPYRCRLCHNLSSKEWKHRNKKKVNASNKAYRLTSTYRDKVTIWNKKRSIKDKTLITDRHIMKCLRVNKNQFTILKPVIDLYRFKLKIIQQSKTITNETTKHNTIKR